MGGHDRLVWMIPWAGRELKLTTQKISRNALFLLSL